MASTNLEIMFNKLGYDLPDNIRQNVEFTLGKSECVHKHCAFLIDAKTRNVIAYDFNVYFKTDSFPFSFHAEVRTIVKFYKSRNLTKNKKILIVVKLSRTGISGYSRCCKSCMTFIRNNFENLNLKKIYYSTKGNTLVGLGKEDLVDENFEYSKGYTCRK